VGGADGRRRSKNINTPKTANAATPPPTPPAIAPTFVFLVLTAVELLVDETVGLLVVVGIVVDGMVVDVGANIVEGTY